MSQFSHIQPKYKKKKKKKLVWEKENKIEKRWVVDGTN